jgi:hypothetical protein
MTVLDKIFVRLRERHKEVVRASARGNARCLMAQTETGPRAIREDSLFH